MIQKENGTSTYFPGSLLDSICTAVVSQTKSPTVKCDWFGSITKWPNITLGNFDNTTLLYSSTFVGLRHPKINSNNDCIGWRWWRRGWRGWLCYSVRSYGRMALAPGSQFHRSITWYIVIPPSASISSTDILPMVKITETRVNSPLINLPKLLDTLSYQMVQMFCPQRCFAPKFSQKYRLPVILESWSTQVCSICNTGVYCEIWWFRSWSIW